MCRYESPTRTLVSTSSKQIILVISITLLHSYATIDRRLNCTYIKIVIYAVYDLVTGIIGKCLHVTLEFSQKCRKSPLACQCSTSIYNNCAAEE